MSITDCKLFFISNWTKACHIKRDHRISSMSVATLQIIQYLTDSQCSPCRSGVMYILSGVGLCKTGHRILYALKRRKRHCNSRAKTDWVTSLVASTASLISVCDWAENEHAKYWKSIMRMTSVFSWKQMDVRNQIEQSQSNLAKGDIVLMQKKSCRYLILWFATAYKSSF